jgi:hypothetical protein
VTCALGSGGQATPAGFGRLHGRRLCYKQATHDRVCPRPYVSALPPKPPRLPAAALSMPSRGVHRMHTGCTPDVHRMHTSRTRVHPVYIRCTSGVHPVCIRCTQREDGSWQAMAAGLPWERPLARLVTLSHAWGKVELQGTKESSAGESAYALNLLEGADGRRDGTESAPTCGSQDVRVPVSAPRLTAAQTWPIRLPQPVAWQRSWLLPPTPGRLPRTVGQAPSRWQAPKPSAQAFTTKPGRGKNGRDEGKGFRPAREPFTYHPKTGR